MPYYEIVIPFDPNITIGPLTLAWHALFSALGIVLGYWIARVYAPKAGVKVEDVDTIAVWCILGGIIGARVVFVIDNWNLFSGNPLKIFEVWSGGMAVWGGILGGISGGVISTFMARLPLPAMADLGGMGLILGQGVGRIGDLINGEHHALATDLPWAFLYTHPNTLATRDATGSTFPEHPATTYELLFDFIIMGIMMYLMRRWGGTGRVFWVYMGLYSLGRFLVSFLRVDPMMGPLQLAQWLGIVGMVLTVLVLVPSFRKKGLAGR